MGGNFWFSIYRDDDDTEILMQWTQVQIIDQIVIR